MIFPPCNFKAFWKPLEVHQPPTLVPRVLRGGSLALASYPLLVIQLVFFFFFLWDRVSCSPGWNLPCTQGWLELLILLPLSPVSPGDWIMGMHLHTQFLSKGIQAQGFGKTRKVTEWGPKPSSFICLVFWDWPLLSSPGWPWDQAAPVRDP